MDSTDTKIDRARAIIADAKIDRKAAIAAWTLLENTEDQAAEIVDREIVRADREAFRVASELSRQAPGDVAPAPAVPAPAPVTHPTITTIAGLQAALCGMFAERDDAIRVVMLAVLARVHVYLHGPAGTGKSALARAIAQALNRSYFEYLLTKFTSPDEIFGGVDLPKWQATGDYVRRTIGRLPEAEIVFLDEVWKGSSAITNCLLTALNERKFANGGTVTSLPLLTAIGASNELPEGEGMDPIWDRFLLRCEVGYVSDRAAFLALVKGADPSPPVTAVDLAAEQAATSRVVIPETVYAALWDIRVSLKADGFIASDRRWKQCLSVVRASAHLAGRTVAETDDLECLEHVLWREPKERAAIARTIGAKTNPDGATATKAYDNARDLFDKLSHDARHAPTPLQTSEIGGALASVERIQGEAAKLTSSRKVDAERAKIETIRATLSQLCLRSCGVKAL